MPLTVQVRVTVTAASPCMSGAKHNTTQNTGGSLSALLSRKKKSKNLACSDILYIKVFIKLILALYVSNSPLYV